MSKRKRGATKGTRFGFTALEEQIVRLLAKHAKHSNTPVKNVARELRISEGSVTMALYRLRRRYDRALDFIEIYREWKKRLPRRKYL